ncbi:acid phosphatase-domain-containing protein [Crepidotus variabilis]|uniref:Acid phosphatase-domain-containing protein n=1 Tax=Crepidotus variabilis TaxID=179855 RepID=A0A9P6E8W3_9AGAR|nr:acid phosphatase-domain-containing protein [Crepidotus variabilis]
MAYPTVVALDTDGTIWENYLDSKRWGKGARAQVKIEDNIDRVDRRLLRDKTNHAFWIRIHNEISMVVTDILKHGAKLAIVSRNPSKALSDRALYYFKTINPKDNKEYGIIHLVNYDEVKNETKILPFNRIHGWSKSDYQDMLMFDDEAFNNCVRIHLGVSFQFIRDKKKGLTWASYQEGLKAWRRSKNLSIAPSPGFVPRRELIGFSGLPTYWINLVNRREGTVETKVPYRWGFALYVADNIEIAKYFSGWNGNFVPDVKSYVCEVWTKDYDAWMRLNKIWVPEHSGALMQMNNMHWSAEQTGKNQEDRDHTIATNWHVYAPYVLFSQHHWMKGMPGQPKQRWPEMVVYTQIQRSLIEIVQLSTDALKKVANHQPHPFHRQFKTWHITAPPPTRQEFLKYGEKDVYKLSA